MELSRVSGRIFDIRRFSVHDGDGIRTTIFLKGCPLCCKWCQNPEGIDPEPRLLYFKNRCIRCGQCVNACPTVALKRDEEGYIHIDRASCALRLDCEKICPARALVPDSVQMTAAEAVRSAMADLPFFRRGGGVTLSGGEPLYQFGFALAILRGLKEEGINTAVESSLFLAPERLKAALPYIDTLFADIKLLDSRTHEAHTGVPNGLILQNLKTLLLDGEQKVVVRTPLIPGYTADERNLRAIASWLHDIRRDVPYELLNYNPLAESKYGLVNREFCFTDNPPLYTPEQMEEWRQIARSAGLSNVF